MTVPTGFVVATRVAGVVKVSDRFLEDGTVIPGALCGPGDPAVITLGEALESDLWHVHADDIPAEAKAELVEAEDKLVQAEAIEESASLVTKDKK